MLWIGTDEVGYGPWVGPLVLAGVAVEAPASLDVQKLWRRLRTSVRRRPGPKDKRDRRLVVCDSKDAFKPHHGEAEALAILERTVISFSRCLEGDGLDRTRFGVLLQGLDGPVLGQLVPRAPWAGEADFALPLSTWEPPRRCVSEALARHGARVVAVSVRLLDAADYNDRVAACGHNKGTLLVDETLRLLQQLLRASRTRCSSDDLPPLEATCGRLGGRKFYGGALGSLGAVLVSTEREDQRVSRYALQGELRGNVEFRVDADADRFLVALASMFAKYVREVYMIALNAWLTRQRKGLKPTAGYGTDGRRFIRECEPILRRRGLPLASLARER